MKTAVSHKKYIFVLEINCKSPDFNLTAEKIIIENNCWIGAKSILSPGVVVKNNTIIKLNSTVSKETKLFFSLVNFFK